jgi:hypothetical protein
MPSFFSGSDSSFSEGQACTRGESSRKTTLSAAAALIGNSSSKQPSTDASSICHRCVKHLVMRKQVMSVRAGLFIIDRAKETEPKIAYFFWHHEFSIVGFKFCCQERFLKIEQSLPWLPKGMFFIRTILLILMVMSKSIHDKPFSTLVVFLCRCIPDVSRGQFFFQLVHPARRFRIFTPTCDSLMNLAE